MSCETLSKFKIQIAIKKNCIDGFSIFLNQNIRTYTGVTFLSFNV